MLMLDGQYAGHDEILSQQEVLVVNPDLKYAKREFINAEMA